ncbi:MAG TPA: GNAT family protein [Pedobacter sp.]
MSTRIRLEYFTKDDYDQLIGWLDNEKDLVNWTGFMFSFPLTHASLDWYLKESNAHEDASVYIYKAVEKATGNVIGHISLGNISEKNRAARISRVWIGREHRGKGFCQDMMIEVNRVGFEELNLHRISLGVFSFNKAAIQCYKKAGFVVEGESRDSVRYKDEWWSMTDMGILEDEWRARSQS